MIKKKQKKLTLNALPPRPTASWMSSASDSAPWLGVHFESLVTVRGVTTTGGLGQQQAWVTRYKLKYRFDSTAPLYWYTNPPGTDPKVVHARLQLRSRVQFDFCTCTLTSSPVPIMS